MTEIMIRDCEVTVLVITFIATLANITIAMKYLVGLYHNMQQWKFIEWDEHHSKQHFAIVGICAIISFAMFLNSFWLKHEQWVFLEHLFFDLVCIFVIYPHLMSEQ